MTDKAALTEQNLGLILTGQQRDPEDVDARGRDSGKTKRPLPS